MLLYWDLEIRQTPFSSFMDSIQSDIVILQNSLQKAEDFHDFLSVLNDALEFPFSQKKLYFHLKNVDKLYHSFQVPKKSGGLRTINAPNKSLKFIQHCLAFILQGAYQPTYSVNGYVTGRSVVSNAHVHANKKFVLNLDLENFFPSITFGRVHAVLQLKPILAKPNVAQMIAKLCCYEGVLPQGAPTSPVLSNMICQRLDRRIESLVSGYQITYTRYADDLTFSSDKPFENGFLSRLDEIIKAEGFTINLEKVRLQLKNSRQEVTGLTVNEKVNVTQQFIREIRAMLHNWGTLGYDSAQAKFLTHYSPKVSKKKKSEPQLRNVVAGKINYLKMVRGNEDTVYQQFKTELTRLEKGEEIPQKNPKLPVWQPSIDRNPRRVVQFLRNFRVVNDTGFRELLHDPDVSDFDFMANLAKVNTQMDGLKSVLTPKLHQKLSVFVNAYNTAGVTYFQEHGLLPLKGRPKQTVSLLARLLLKKAKMPVLEQQTTEQVAVAPDRAVSKAAKVFREQIRVGSDYFQDLILVNALKPIIESLNETDSINVSFQPSENEFGINCSFFTDTWESVKALRSVLKDLALNTDYQTPTDQRNIWLRSAVIHREAEKEAFFATVIYIHLEGGKIESENAFKHIRLLKTQQRLCSLADWSVLYQDANSQTQEFFFLNSDANRSHQAPNYEGITHKLTFYHS